MLKSTIMIVVTQFGGYIKFKFNYWEIIIISTTITSSLIPIIIKQYCQCHSSLATEYSVDLFFAVHQPVRQYNCGSCTEEQTSGQEPLITFSVKQQVPVQRHRISSVIPQPLLIKTSLVFLSVLARWSIGQLKKCAVFHPTLLLQQMVEQYCHCNLHRTI